MKKIAILFLIFTMCLSASCTATKKGEDDFKKEAVVINLPDNDNVNGYRTTTPSNTEENIGIAYCGNKNSKIFHKTDCSSVSNMKNENKVNFVNRNEAVTKGYTPCHRCNP